SRDWSSDVCSSDLPVLRALEQQQQSVGTVDQLPAPLLLQAQDELVVFAEQGGGGVAHALDQRGGIAQVGHEQGPQPRNVAPLGRRTFHQVASGTCGRLAIGPADAVATLALGLVTGGIGVSVPVVPVAVNVDQEPARIAPAEQALAIPDFPRLPHRGEQRVLGSGDRKSTRLNSSHVQISYA